MGETGSPVHGARETLLELLTGFHPARKPVLWRMLLAQHMLYTVLLRDDDPLAAPLDAPSAEDLAVFDWRRPGVDDDSDADISSPMLAAHEYVRKKA